MHDNASEEHVREHEPGPGRGGPKPPGHGGDVPGKGNNPDHVPPRRPAHPRRHYGGVS